LRPAWLEIDRSAITENVRRIREYVGPQTAALAVVKANGYGHGLVPSARAALAGGASGLGVAILDEALELQAGGVQSPILILGAPLPDCAEEIVAAGVSQVVSCRETIEAFSAAAQTQKREIGLHLKVDTGMSRVGADPLEALELAHLIQDSPGLRLEAVCTHFATSDEDPEAMEAQDQVFRATLDALEREGLHPACIHAAASAAIQRAPGSKNYGMVRAGLLTYGCPPLGSFGPELIPALRWKSRLVQVRSFERGARVGYGLTAKLERDSRLAVVPLGYADGWPRALSHRGRVLVRGEWAPVVGRVSMDQCTVDVTEIPGAALGDEVALVGEQGERKQTVEDVAVSAQTNTHDILAGLSPRLPRIYS
jgi:alanine racemase